MTRCYAVPCDEYRQHYKIKTTLDDCTLEVGVDIEAGEYKLVSTSDMGYYCIYADTRHDINNIIANDNFTGQNYCNVKGGQYLVLRRCKISE